MTQRRNVTVCATCVASHKTIPAFYALRDYRPAWADRAMAQELIDFIQGIEADGLNRQDYYYDTLVSLLAGLDSSKATGGVNQRMVADFDVLATDALLRLCHHLFFGKIDPEGLDPNWNLERTIGSLSPRELLTEIVSTGEVTARLDALRPSGPYYRRLKEELARLRGIEAKGGWPILTAEDLKARGCPRLMRPSDSCSALDLLAKRLFLEGVIDHGEYAELLDNWYKPPEGSKPLVAPMKDRGDHSRPTLSYQEPLVTYVKRFQRRHGLLDDGVIGPNTVAALSIPVEKAIDMVRVNLERARWVMHDLPEEYLLVNIASFTLSYVQDRSGRQTALWQGRVQVGTTNWQTPVFKSDLKYIVLNPYWNVPPSILRRELVPHLLLDPDYLSKNRMEVVDFQGRPVDPSNIDWEAVAKGGPFPYMVRQRPGPDNALGLVKFLFPNRHHVFIHDTPSKANFEKDKRAFSHGCIRLEHPLDLAKLLLASLNGMGAEEVDAIVESGENKTIRLDRFIPVLILYWTVEVGPDKALVYLEDIYQRDVKILLGLDTPFSLEVSPYPFIGE